MAQLLCAAALAALALPPAAALRGPGADPVPPCPAPFPHTAVGETWCSTPLAANAASGVQVAQYGFPAGSTLVTAATSPQVWYSNDFFLGGGVAGGSLKGRSKRLHRCGVWAAPLRAAHTPLAHA